MPVPQRAETRDGESFGSKTRAGSSWFQGLRNGSQLLEVHRLPAPQRAHYILFVERMKGSFLGRLEGTGGEEGPSRGGGWRVFTRLSSSGSSLKKGLCSCSCWWTKFSMSTSKLAEVMHSEPWVACSHFSNSSVRSGKRGCLWGHQELTHAHTDTCSWRAQKPPGSLSHIPNTSSPRVPLPEHVPRPHDQPGWQHFMSWWGRSHLLFPGPQQAGIPPHGG